MGILEKVYENSPIFFQNIMTSVKGYLQNRNRYGETYYEYRDFLKEFDKLPILEKRELQEKSLINFIKFAYVNSPFYRELYKDIDMTEINTISDIKKLPIVDKEMLRKNINKVNTIDRQNGVIAQTGGTTGKSLEVLYTPEDMMKRMATLDHFKSRVGFEHLEMRRATFNGQHIIPPHQRVNNFWRYNAACKQMIYSSFDLTEENMKYYVQSLNKFKPHAIDGFFMSMVDIANYIERHNIEIEFTPVAIFPTSEALTDEGRELLEKVFQCKVYDQYASSEGAPFVTEFENQVLHMELATGYIEHLDDRSDEVLVTSFTTHGTPLIRYKIGDSMDFEKNDIDKHNAIEAPVVNNIHGRKLDFIYSADGAKIPSGNISNAFKNIPNSIIRSQVVQNKIGEVKILLEIDKDNYQRKYDEILANEFEHKLGTETKININYVDEIPREKSGKYRMIVNNISIK